MKSMIMCKIFESGSSNDLEERINEFAKNTINHDFKIVDIQYQTDSALKYSALVLYEVKGV